MELQAQAACLRGRDIAQILKGLAHRRNVGEQPRCHSRVARRDQAVAESLERPPHCREWMREVVRNASDKLALGTLRAFKGSRHLVGVLSDPGQLGRPNRWDRLIERAACKPRKPMTDDEHRARKLSSD